MKSVINITKNKREKDEGFMKNSRKFSSGIVNKLFYFLLWNKIDKPGKSQPHTKESINNYLVILLICSHGAIFLMRSSFRGRILADQDRGELL